MPSKISSLTRLYGKYYTPGFLVQAMLRLVLDPLLESRRPGEGSLRALDPACGEGAFLAPVHDRLKGWYHRHGSECDRLIGSHIFGADIDRSALAALRLRFASERQEQPGWDLNFCWGDSLTGPGFGESASGNLPLSTEENAAPDLDWADAFPQVAEQGGFDLVIGNPPYRRERASKQAWERLKQSPLGKRRHQARLDLWAYFLHRGLDLLREGGRLAYILPSYWTASAAAGQLIDRLKAETMIRDVILLGRSPVFPDVEGWHLILSLAKERQDEPCRVWDLSSAGKHVAEHLAYVPGGSSGDFAASAPVWYHLDQSELFGNGQLDLNRPEPRIQILHRSPTQTLADRFEVRQGIVENPRRITRAMAAQSADGLRVGEGVFVLSADELAALKLTAEEKNLLRPYYRGTDIDRYWLAESPSEYLLYLTRESAPTLEAFPGIEAHLARFRPLLENRREFRKGRIAWWHLHWPRQSSLFVAPRILMPQMGYEPRFVFCEQPAFVGFAMHIVRLKPAVFDTDPAMALAALTGLLNSKLAAIWFRRFAKHRGAALDISGTLLKRFVLPPADSEAEAALARLVRHRQRMEPADSRRRLLEAEIESLVEKWYES